MADEFGKVRPGQSFRIPAAAYNGFVDAANDYKRRQQGATAGSEARPFRQPGLIKVRNDTGADLDRYAVVALAEAVIDPADDEDAFLAQPAMTAATPVADDPGPALGILQEPLADGDIGFAVVMGVTPATIEVDAAADDAGYASAAAGGTTDALVLAQRGPAQVLWREPGTGSKWALVLMTGPVPEAEFPVKVTAVNLKADGCRYYSWTEQVYAEGCDGFDDKDDGREGDGGAKILVTRITKGDDVTAEVQRVLVTGATSGTFRSSVTGSADIAWDADEATIQGYLDAENGAGVITYSAATHNYTWTDPGARDLITFTDTSLRPAPKDPLHEYNNKEITVPSYQRAWLAYNPRDVVVTKTQRGNGTDQNATWSVYLDGYTDGTFKFSFDGDAGRDIDHDETDVNINGFMDIDFSPAVFDVLGLGTKVDPWVITAIDFDDHDLKIDGANLRGGKRNYRFVAGAGTTLWCPGTSISGYVEGGMNVLVIGDNGCLRCIQPQECP